MKKHFSATLALLLLSAGTSAQPGPDTWETDVRQFDALYWNAYNACDLKAMAAFNANDLEFYHDLGGASVGKASFIKALKNNICGDPELHIRRAAVADTIKIYPLRKRGQLYGAVIEGEHAFYNKVRDKPEVMGTLARFSHVLLVKNGVWQVSRVLSYDHHDAPYDNKRIAIVLPAAQLDQLTGTYKTSKKIPFRVTRVGNALSMDVQGIVFALHPSDPSTFFVKERDLTITFARGPDGKGRKLTVREAGDVAEEATSRKQ
jgi:hypothetical protein